uniref:Uncharacterized protein n=1 Tax=Ditylenchus dipsaci TaxID=166011 RepID=A0A915E483_9BILA
MMSSICKRKYSRGRYRRGSSQWVFGGVERGVGAFLIPYFTCSFFIGFPMLYMELSLGQFCRVGPAVVVYGRVRPFLQGIGWIMVNMALIVSLYYNMIVGWTIIYLYKIVTGQAYQWSSCINQFNTPYCTSSLEDDRCTRELEGSLAIARLQSNSSISAFISTGLAI